VRYVIWHETLLSFPKPVREHQCELRLVPRSDEGQRVVAAEIKVVPEAHLGGYLDCFGNRVSTMSLVTPHDTLSVVLDAEVETRLANPFDYAPVTPAQEAEWIASELRRDPRLWDFSVHRSDSVPELADLEKKPGFPAHDARAGIVASMQAIMEWAADTFQYEAGATVVHAPLAEFFEKGAGVCQDFAHLLVAVARSSGIPARYAMGYLDPGYAERDDEDDAEHDDHEHESEQEHEVAVEGDPAGATHAWAEVLVPGAGWRGFDPIQRLMVNDTYVTVAVGRDSRDAAPLRGSFKGDAGGESPRVRLRVSRQQAQMQTQDQEQQRQRQQQQ
jgi:transglutaminase-like putative cysteine protease